LKGWSCYSHDADRIAGREGLAERRIEQLILAALSLDQDLRMGMHQRRDLNPW
jgi:hypothetical protein